MYGRSPDGDRQNTFPGRGPDGFGQVDELGCCLPQRWVGVCDIPVCVGPSVCRHLRRRCSGKVCTGWWFPGLLWHCVDKGCSEDGLKKYSKWRLEGICGLYSKETLEKCE